MLNKLKQIFNRRDDEEKVIGMLFESQKNSNNHLIALARLLFISPDALVREAQNQQANAEYLLLMVKALEDSKKIDEKEKENNEKKKN